MLAPDKNARKRPKKATNLNRSSKPKGPKKDKKSLSLNALRKNFKELVDDDELLLMKIFDDAKIQSLLDEIPSDDGVKRRNRVYTPQVTLSLFVPQALSKDSGCKEMVTLLNKQRKKQQLSKVSTNPLNGFSLSVKVNSLLPEWSCLRSRMRGRSLLSTTPTSIESWHVSS